MAKLFRPTVSIDGINEQYPTYAKVKSELKSLIKKSNEKIVRVYRSRRGNWGEWFEHWSLNHNNKPTIIKQGWM